MHKLKWKLYYPYSYFMHWITRMRHNSMWFWKIFPSIFPTWYLFHEFKIQIKLEPVCLQRNYELKMTTQYGQFLSEYNYNSMVLLYKILPYQLWVMPFYIFYLTGFEILTADSIDPQTTSECVNKQTNAVLRKSSAENRNR